MAKKKQQPKPPWLQWFLDRREFLLWLGNIASLAVSIWGHLKPTPPVQMIVQLPPPQSFVAAYSMVSWETTKLLTGTGVYAITGSDATLRHQSA